MALPLRSGLPSGRPQLTRGMIPREITNRGQRKFARKTWGGNPNSCRSVQVRSSVSTRVSRVHGAYRPPNTQKRWAVMHGLNTTLSGLPATKDLAVIPR